MKSLVDTAITAKRMMLLGIRTLKLFGRHIMESMGSDNDHITFLYHDVFEIHLGKFGGKNAASMQDKIIEHEEGYL